MAIVKEQRITGVVVFKEIETFTLLVGTIIKIGMKISELKI